MSVDCNITLPNDARLSNVAEVMGLLAGLPLTEREADGGNVYPHVSGVEVKTSSMPEMALIHLSGKMMDGTESHRAYFHYEGERKLDDEHNALCRMVSVASTSFWLAIARGLVDFFGGSVDYQDWDDRERDYYKKQQPHINAVDGDSYKALMDRIRAVKPITKEQIKECRQWAAYTD